jgi:hypothetical protein
MKSFTKLLLVGAVAVMAMAVTVAPSEAKRHKKMAAPAPCMPGMLCTTPNAHVMACGGDGKWYQAIFTPFCAGPICPPKCS